MRPWMKRLKADEPNTYSAAEVARSIAAGSLKRESLVAAWLERIVAREPQVRAWACVDRELALKQAQVLN
jgi:Asp-tRNA(Asn)/Glu-tRNA(Gln) amidotransferase A subunit family amidase